MIILEPGFYYHIYNHANGSEDIFKEERNYTYFLDKYKNYIHPVAQTFAYCLMKNHFHFLIRVRDHIESEKTSDVFETSDVSQETSDISKTASCVLSNLTIPNAFKNLFQSYTKAINKAYGRKGSLFNQHFKRKQIKTDQQLLNALIYIHMNPVTHSFCDKPDQWRYSSYNAYLQKSNKTLINTHKGIELFDNLENFIYCHTAARAEQYDDQE